MLREGSSLALLSGGTVAILHRQLRAGASQASHCLPQEPGTAVRAPPSTNPLASA